MEENKEEQNTATSLVALERLILSYLSQMETINEEYRNKAEMLRNVLENDVSYTDADKKAKEASKERSQIKANILKVPENADLDRDIKDVRVRVREMKKNLSDYLHQYAQLAGTNQIEDEDGGVREIVYVAKLVKRSNKFRT